MNSGPAEVWQFLYTLKFAAPPNFERAASKVIVNHSSKTMPDLENNEKNTRITMADLIPSGMITLSCVIFCIAGSYVPAVATFGVLTGCIIPSVVLKKSRKLALIPHVVGVTLQLAAFAFVCSILKSCPAVYIAQIAAITAGLIGTFVYARAIGLYRQTNKVA